MLLSSENNLNPEVSIGKITLGVFMAAFSICFLVVKYIWFQTFCARLMLANDARNITLDIDARNKTYMRKFTLVRQMSTICTFKGLL